MERPAFDRLLTTALPKIERSTQSYAARYNIRHEWQDLAQSAILKMLRFADVYDPDKGEFMPWACVVIINTIKTHIAQIATAPDMCEFNSLIVEQTKATDNPEMDLQVGIILDNLNDEARLFFEGYNYTDIAARRGLGSKSTVRDRINSCADRLRRVLGINAERCPREKMRAPKSALKFT